MNSPLPIKPVSGQLPPPPPRRGWLRHGNAPGDYAKAPRCGARTRAGGCCRQPAMKNGRCRMHGGLSTGPRTAEGLARARRARWKHGFDSAETRALRRAAAETCRALAAGVRLARAEIRRRRDAAAGRGPAQPRSSAAGGSASLGMGWIERISTLPPVPLDGSQKDSPRGHEEHEGSVGASCARPSPARRTTGDRRSPLRATDRAELLSSTSSLGMGFIEQISLAAGWSCGAAVQPVGQGSPGPGTREPSQSPNQGSLASWSL